MPKHSILTRGLNLWSWGSDVNMAPGDSQDMMNVLLRPNGSIRKHWGYERPEGARAVTISPPLGMKGFNYKGKNTVAVADPARRRTGNFNLVNDGANYTLRQAFYSSCIVMDYNELRFWNPTAAAGTWDLPNAYQHGGGGNWLPVGVTVLPDPKPSFMVLQNNVYITGWASVNLRYDPVDRTLYQWGWEAAPANAGHTGPGGMGGTLVAGARYQYRLSYIDLYTAEESPLSAAYVAVPAAGQTITLDNFIAYAGTRHWKNAVELDDQDVGIVVYRTEPDGETFYFLTLVNPGLAAAVFVDNGLATDKSIRADVENYVNAPYLNAVTEYRNQWFGVSWRTNWARVYYNDFRKEKSYIERTRIRNYRGIPIKQGEVLVAVANVETGMIVFSNTDAYGLNAVPSETTGRIEVSVRPMGWGVGCIGPRAWLYRNNTLYWISDHGPYAWKGGEPVWIGKPISPMFVDPGTNLCQISEDSRALAEMAWDPDARAIRMCFACGNSVTNNRHLLYFPEVAELNGDPASAWSMCSPLAQAFDYNNVLEYLVAGFPVTPFEKRPRMCFIDEQGYVGEYDPTSLRAGVPAVGPVVSGLGQAGSTLFLLVTLGGLFWRGTGMAGLRMEIHYADGSVDVREILSNTAANIVPVIGFSQSPVGATFYVTGYPSYWKSWVDHEGAPADTKTLLHLWPGYHKEFAAEGREVTLTVASGDFPPTPKRTREFDLAEHRDQLLVSLTGRMFWWQVENNLPDQPWDVTYFETEYAAPHKRGG